MRVSPKYNAKLVFLEREYIFANHRATTAVIDRFVYQSVAPEFDFPANEPLKLKIQITPDPERPK